MTVLSRIRIEPFSLQKTLECGQFFRYTKVKDTYVVQASGRIFSLVQKGKDLFYDGVEESFLYQFLRLEENLEPILNQIDQDAVIHQALQYGWGMRLIRQDPWECLVSFLFSSAKAIPHIRCLIETLCTFSKKKVRRGRYIGYPFPDPQCIQASYPLEGLRAGFRTEYLVKISQSIDRNQLFYLRRFPYREARERLMKLAGVGKKIADCVLLYSLDFLEAFPIDTWIRKGMERFYFSGEKVGDRRMEEFVRNHFGPYAGYAQLYLYHYWRTHHRF